MCNLHWLALTLTDWYANICKKLLPISKHFAKIVTKAVFVLNFANCIDIDRLRVILWRICELGWGRGPIKKGGGRYQTSMGGGHGNKKGWQLWRGGGGGGGHPTTRVESGTKPVCVGGGAMGARRVDPCTWLGCVGMYCGPPSPSPSHPHFHNCSGCCPTFPLLLFFATRWVW